MARAKANQPDTAAEEGRGKNGARSGEQWVSGLGKLIRESRQGRYTVEQLAAQANLSAGLISQLERGVGNPSFMTLLRIASALDLPLSTFFQGPGLDPDGLIVRAGERRRMVIPSDGIVHEMLVPPAPHKVGVLKTVLPPGFSNEDQPAEHPGEEVLLVVRGTLEGNIGGQPFVLHEGDSITFDSGIPHALTNSTDQEVELLGISTPPFTGGAH